MKKKWVYDFGNHRKDSKMRYDGWPDNLRRLVEEIMEPCKHVERKTNLDGETIEKPYTSIWCPDCHLRIVKDYKASPFKLRNR